MRTAHGSLTIAVPRGCDRCHHESAGPESCTQCHSAERFAAALYPQTVRMSVAGLEHTRPLPFTHQEHTAVECARCHLTPDMRVAADSCEGCHREHHEEARDCMACHDAAPADAHPVRVHVTCSGSGCHNARFLPAQQRSRTSCLVCHRDQVDHRPGERCADCHVLPPFRGTAGVAP